MVKKPTKKILMNLLSTINHKSKINKIKKKNNNFELRHLLTFFDFLNYLFLILFLFYFY